MPSDKTFEDKWQKFEAAVSSAPSVADDVMRHIEERPIPVRRRQWVRSPAMVACAATILGIVGVTVAAWIVAGGRDRDTVALHSANSTDRQLPRSADVIPLEQTQDEGSGQEHFHEAASVDPPLAGDVENDSVDRHLGDVVSTQPGAAPGAVRLTPSPDTTDGQARETRVPIPNTHPERRDGREPFGLPAVGTAGSPDGRADGLNGDDGKGWSETRLPKSKAIHLAVKCIRDAEPNTRLKLNAKSAVARYYHKSKAHNGNSLWLVAFPEAERKGAETGNGEGEQAILYRMVWVEEDGSYSGNCQGKLPPTDPPVLLGRDEEAKAIRIAKGFLLRHHPEHVGHRPPTATFNTDNRSFGGGPIWIVGFTFKEDPPPPTSHVMWVMADGTVVLGGVSRMGPRPSYRLPEDKSKQPEPEAADSSAASSEPVEKQLRKGAARSEVTSWGAAVDGLQCRLHIEKRELNAGQWPRLLVDVKNQGERELTLGDAPDFWELECDGTWYRNGVMFSGDCEILDPSPSETLRNFPLPLAERWKWHAKDGKEPLAFKPGKHVLRVALRPAPKQEGKWPRVVSNPVEIEILPAQPAPD